MTSAIFSNYCNAGYALLEWQQYLTNLDVTTMLEALQLKCDTVRESFISYWFIWIKSNLEGLRTLIRSNRG